MKILYHHRIASKDGQYVHVEELTKALKMLGHEIIMVCPEISGRADFGSKGGLVPLLKRFMPGFIYELLELGYAFHAYAKLSKAVKLHNPDCLYERYNLYTPAGVWIKKRFKLPMLLEVNAPIFQERKKYDGIAIPWLARWIERYTWQGADMVLPVTEVLAELVKEAGVDTKHINVIPNGIDLEKFKDVPDAEEAKKRLGLQNKLVLGFTGFVREWHGLERVADLLANETTGLQRHLLVVGDGPARHDIEKRATKMGLNERITFTGIIAREEVAKYVAAFDIALQPDVVAYASPLKLFEYMVLERAVVAPDTANIREVLKNNVNAILFDPEKPTAMCESIEMLCKDRILRLHIAQAARETIFLKGFTWSNNAERVTNLINRMRIRTRA